jgi:asparagine synthase (glutamine-hydrolysing)
MEKSILREAFQNDSYLPFDVLWRKKEAFSDGVSSKTDSWYKRCTEYANEHGYTINADTAGVHNPPKTAEAFWYRMLFETYYGSQAVHLIPHMWMPKWVAGADDPSARTLTFYTQ